jgi:hypothetical protein
MNKPGPDRIADPLFVDDEELGRHMNLPFRKARQLIAVLDGQPGFPPKLSEYGGRRYLPAIRAYFDRLYVVESQHGAARVAAVYPTSEG